MSRERVLLATVMLLGSRVAAGDAPSPKAAVPRKDLHGDPLPAGALARLGALRFRHPHTVRDVAFSADGKLLAIEELVAHPGRNEYRIRLLDVTTGKNSPLPEGVPDHPLRPRARFTADGKRLVIATGGEVLLWDCASGKRVPPFGKLDDRLPDIMSVISCLALSPDGRTAALGFQSRGAWELGRRQVVLLWDLVAGKELRRLTGHASGRDKLTFSADGRHVTAVCRNAGWPDRPRWHGEAHTWEVSTGKLVGQFTFAGEFLALSADGSKLAYNREKKTLIVALPAGKEVCRLRFPSNSSRGARDAVFSQDGTRLATVDLDWLLFLWDARSGRLLREIHLGERGSSHLLAFSPDGKLLATAAGIPSRNHALRLWEVATGKEYRPFGGHQDALRRLAFSPDGALLATAGGDQTVRLWEAATGKERHHWTSRLETVAPIAFSDARTLVAPGGNGDLALRDVSSGRLRHQLALDKGEVIAVGLSASRKSLLAVTETINEQRWVQSWSLPKGNAERRFALPDSPSGLARFMESSNTLVVVTRTDKASPSTIRLWDVGEARPWRSLRLPAGTQDDPPWCYHAALSANGRFLGTCENSGLFKSRVRLWEVASARVAHQWDMDGYSYIANWDVQSGVVLAFSPDSRWLVCGNREGTLVFRDVLTGKQRHTLRGHTGKVTALAFSDDGKRLASGSEDETALLWDVGTFPAGDPVASRPLSPMELDGFWADLASAEPATALRAQAALIAAPRQALPLLRERLKAAAPVKGGRFAGPIAELNSASFAVRRKAAAALTGRTAAGPALRSALRGALSLEQRKRIEQLLDNLETMPWHTEELLAVRGVFVLERIGGEQSRRVLQSLADGDPEAPLTRQAADALRRTGK